MVGIYATQENTTPELLQSLVTWAHNNKGEGQSILLLIDDLEAITKLDQQTEQNLRWLLLRGPSRRVWPIVTINASRAHEYGNMAWILPHTLVWTASTMQVTPNFITNDPRQNIRRSSSITIYHARRK